MKQSNFKMKKLCWEILKIQINELSRLGQNVLRKKVPFILYTDIILCILYNEIALLTRRRFEQGARNRNQIIFRKLLTIYIQKMLIKQARRNEKNSGGP